MDNLNIKGIESDEPQGRRSKPRGKQKKPYAIECLFNAQHGWGIWGRYRTKAARNQAYAALVKKATTPSYWWHNPWQYRKVDPDEPN